MTRLLDRLPTGARIAVIRLRSLGDCVLTTPALALLRSHRPDLDITMIVEPRFAAVFEGSPDVNAIVEEPPKSADLVLNLHGGTRSLWWTFGISAPFKAGFGHHRLATFLTHRIPRAQEILGEERPVHTAEHLASAMFWLGVPQTEIPRARLFAERFEERRAVIHPFASQADKTWPAERFVEVARALKNPVILAGPGDDAAPFAEFEVWKNEPLARVKSLMSSATLFIGNDSGPAHIAAAFGVPVVVLFGSSDAVTWAPWRTESQVMTDLAKVTVDRALGAIESLKVGA